MSDTMIIEQNKGKCLISFGTKFVLFGNDDKIPPVAEYMELRGQCYTIDMMSWVLIKAGHHVLSKPIYMYLKGTSIRLD